MKSLNVIQLFLQKKTFNFQRRCSVDVNIPICLTENLKKSNFTTSSDLTIASQEPRSNFEIGGGGGGGGATLVTRH